MPTDTRTTAAGNFLLELDGKRVGSLRAVEGGEPYADVVSEPGKDGLVSKRPGQLHYAPITISVGFGMDPLFFDWIAATLDHRPVRKNGAVIFASYDFQEISRLSFKDAIITELRFPAFDASVKEAGYLTVTFQPRDAQSIISAPGAKLQTSAPKPKPWTTSNFRLRIPGLDAACMKVSAIDAIIVTSADVSPPDSKSEKLGGSVLVSNPLVTAAETVAADFASWFDDNAVRGNPSERTATIDALSADLSTVLFTLSLSNVGIVRVKHERFDTGIDRLRHVSVELYCETITLILPVASSAVASAVVAPATPVLKPLAAPSPVQPL